MNGSDHSDAVVLLLFQYCRWATLTAAFQSRKSSSKLLCLISPYFYCEFVIHLNLNCVFEVAAKIAIFLIYRDDNS